MCSVESSSIKSSYKSQKTNNEEWNAANRYMLYTEILATGHNMSVPLPHNVYVYILKQAKNESTILKSPHHVSKNRTLNSYPKLLQMLTDF